MHIKINKKARTSAQMGGGPPESVQKESSITGPVRGWPTTGHTGAQGVTPWTGPVMDAPWMLGPAPPPMAEGKKYLFHVLFHILLNQILTIFHQIFNKNNEIWIFFLKNSTDTTPFLPFYRKN